MRLCGVCGLGMRDFVTSNVQRMGEAWSGFARMRAGWRNSATSNVQRIETLTVYIPE